MPDRPGFVKYHRKALCAESTLRQVSRADRATLLDYVALARWKAPYLGCLCDEDGTPWSRKRRAAEVGESYSAIKRTEESLMAAGLITFQGRNVDHHSSVGRLHIAQFETYQGNGKPPKSEAESDGLNETASGIEGNSLRNRSQKAPKSEATVEDRDAFDIEGTKARRLMLDGDEENPTSAGEASEIGACTPQEVKKGTYKKYNKDWVGVSGYVPVEEDGYEGTRAGLREGLSKGECFLLDEFLKHLAETKDEGKLLKATELTATHDLLLLREAYGEEAWRYGMETANRKPAPNPRYVRACAEGYDPSRPSKGNPSSYGGSIRPPSDFSNVKLDKWGQPLKDQGGAGDHDKE